MAGTPTGRGRQREREGVPMTFIHRTHARTVRKWWPRRADGTMSHVVWAHFPEMQGNKELHFEIEGPVDLKNFTAVLHDNVQAREPARCGSHTQLVLLSTAHEQSTLFHRAHEHPTLFHRAHEHPMSTLFHRDHEHPKHETTLHSTPVGKAQARGGMLP